MRRLILICLLFCATAAQAFDDPRQNAAAELMSRCEAALWQEKLRRLLDFDVRYDPDHTGLVGRDDTELVTTPGSWHDKRAAAQPAMAGAICGYLLCAGLKEGDLIGINATSSYPGFVLATLCAARVLGLETVFVLSYGTSMYGGTLPEFTLPVMFDTLRGAGLLDVKIDALTPGGIDDRIRKNIFEEDALPVVRALMAARSETCLIPAGHRASMAFRRGVFAARPLKAFVSCGGSWLSLGRSMESGTLLPHGLIMPPYPVESENWDRGLIRDYLAKGVPCLNLLFTRGICEDWGLPHGKGPEPNF